MIFPNSVAVSYYLAVEYQQLLAGEQLHEVRYRREDKTFLFLFAGKRNQVLEFSFAPPHLLLRREDLHRRDSFEVWPEIARSRVEKVVSRRDNRMIDIELTHEAASGDIERWSIRFELFGALCNAYLMTQAGEIQRAIRVVKDNRGLRPGALYSDPVALKRLPGSGKSTIFETSDATYTLIYEVDNHRVEVIPRPGEPTFEPESKAPLVSLFEYLATHELSTDNLPRRKEKLLQDIEKEIEHHRAQIRALRRRLNRCSEAEKYSRIADLLMANPKALPVDGEVRVKNLYGEGEIDIPLLKGKNVIESATGYYRLARKLTRAPDFLRPRIASLNARTDALLAAIEKIGSIQSAAELAAFAGSLGLKRTAKRAIASTGTEESLPYRTFRSSDGEKILVGKSAADNEVLTFKIARSYDYWFHTQQSRGSHVILVLPDKNRKPSRRSIETAAALAAFYSDERRGSLVPVIYTQRRHVRKARKGAPGLVIPEQVESIFVEPAVPNQPDTNPD